MTSIKGRLLYAFLSVIAILSIASLIFFGISVWVTQQYRQITDTMIAEYQLVENAQTLIDAYNSRVQSIGTDTKASQEHIDSAEANINRLTQILDKTTLDIRSKSDYLGFNASIQQFTKQVNESLLRSEQGNIKDYFDDYNEANKRYGFVRDNGTSLLFSELKYASALQEEINNTYRIGISFGLGMLALIFIGTIFFVLRFAVRLTKPLVDLTHASQQMAEGNVDVAIRDAAFSSTDEFGILAQSFSTMAVKLRDKIAELDARNKQIAGSAEILSTKNHDLEKLNKLMVDRELKMVELKRRIAELEAKRE